jgi:hypothetical protein
MTIEQIVDLAIRTCGDPTITRAIVILAPDGKSIRLINLIS